MKLNDTLQVLTHVKELKSLKDYDEQQAANSIRSLDRGQTKILQCGFTGMRGK